MPKAKLATLLIGVAIMLPWLGLLIIMATVANALREKSPRSRTTLDPIKSLGKLFR